MVAAFAVAVLITLALGWSSRYWGPHSPIHRVLVSTFLGIAAAITAWMVVGTIWTIPERAGQVLGIWMVVVASSLVLIGRSGGSSRTT